MSSDQTSAVCNQVKPKCRCRRWALGCLVVLLIAALPVWWFCLRSVPLRISKETTYITKPLTADGKRVDYFKALEQKVYPLEMQTDDNGFRLFAKHCALSEETIEGLGDQRKQFYEKLALDPNEQPTLKLESVEVVFDRLNKDKAKEERQEYERKPWSFEKYPMLEDWLKENTAGIDLLGEAVRKPAFCIPYTRKNENMWDTLFPVVLNIRNYARAAACRANYRIAIGDIDGAIYDTMTIYRLGRFVSKQGTILNHLFGFAIDGTAHSIAINDNPDHPLTKEQIERFLREYGTLPPKFTTREGLDTERLFTLDAIRCFPWYDDEYTQYRSLLYRLPVDANVIYIFFNQVYDSLDSLGAREHDELYWKSSNPLRYLTVKGRTKQICYAMANLFLPAVSAYKKAAEQNECCGNLKCLTLALLLYEKEHGKLPAKNWREAVKPYLGEKPEQYWHCPMPMRKTDYALVISEKRTGETPLLVEADVANISENGTIPNEPELFVCPVPETSHQKYPHAVGYHISHRNGTVSVQKEEK